MDGYSEITGKITAILFRNDASSFTVAKFRLYELNEERYYHYRLSACSN